MTVSESRPDEGGESEEWEFLDTFNIYSKKAYIARHDCDRWAADQGKERELAPGRYFVYLRKDGDTTCGDMWLHNRGVDG